MQMQGNTLFITGGSSGIGRGLAESFHRLGNQVIIGGRREEALRATCEANPGMQFVPIDTSDGASIRAAAARVIQEFPALNTVINNAGIQRVHDFTTDQAIDDAELMQEVNTNLIGVVRLCGAFLPHLRQQETATLMNVSSGLALVPLARFPVYCATKAAVHSFTQSLRYQLKDTSVKIVEIIPPYVSTDLDQTTRQTRPIHGGPQPMPLEDYITAVMAELAAGCNEAAVGTAKASLAAIDPPVKQIFERINSLWR